MKSPKSRGSNRKEEVAQKNGFLMFKDLPEQEANQWLEAEDEDAVQQLVRNFLQLESSECDLKEAALLDFYSAAALWCREQEMSATELSITFSVCKLILEKIEAGAEKPQLVLEVKQLLSNTDEEMQSGLESLESAHLQSLIEHLMRTVLQHHSLYVFLLRQQPEQVIVTQEVPADALPPATVPFPPPLCEGMPEDLYRRAVLRSGTSKARTVVEEEIEAPEADDAAAAAEDLEQQQQQLDLEAAMQNLTADDMREAVDSVCQEVLCDLESELAAKIKEREINWINKINKVHNTA